MGITLKVNELGYLPFLDTPVSSFIVGLKDFSINQDFCLSIKDLPDCINTLKQKQKKLYLNINSFFLQKDITKLQKIINKLKVLDIDGFVISDLGVLNVFIDNNLENKVILDLHTYVTNKYSAKSLLDLGIKRVCVAREITLKDIQDISIYTNGKIQLQCQGYYPITHSKRNILDAYYKNFNLDKKSSIHYIKEESRDSYYALSQSNNNLTVYYDKEYSLFPYLKDLMSYNCTHFTIDANFLDERTIKEYIDYYKKGIDSLLSNNIDLYNSLNEEFTNKYSFETPFMMNKSFLLKEDK